LTFAAHLAKLAEAQLTVLTVIKKPDEQQKADDILTHAREVLAPLISLQRVQMKSRVGHPAESIVSEAEEHHYDLVVVGEKQHHGLLTRFVLGSTAQRVIEHAPCPVVLVKGRVGPIETLLICDSGIPGRTIVDSIMEQLPKLLAAAQQITVLHVMSQMGAGPGIDGRQLRAGAVELIQQDSPEGQVLHHDLQVLGLEGFVGTPKVRHGLVVEEILAEAKEGGYDLVVIGAHRGSGWRRILLDDISHQIVMELDRPVLLMR
jgi:nucleotide-binding universal stress UspA family protein